MVRWLTLSLLLLPQLSFGAGVNAGFVQGMWYSDDTPLAEVVMRVYVAIRNNTNGDLSGTVTFYDNGKKVSAQSVTALDGRIIESWTDWKPTSGEHTLKAELTRATLSVVGSSTESVTVAVAAAQDTIFVDIDTDGDTIGNTNDTDDDNDGISDETETARGTDPLTSQTPKKETTNSSSDNQSESKTTAQSTENTPNTTAESEGLEHYLTPSRADTILAGITSITEQAKAKVDAYRASRATTTPTNSTSVTVDNDGFGAITRSTDAPTLPKQSEPGSGFMHNLAAGMSTLLHALVTALLALLSLLLGHPVFIQLLILIGILCTLYLIAKKLGSRPSGKKKK